MTGEAPGEPAGYGWSGPLVAALAGVLSIPLLFVSATAFVLALFLGAVGVLVGCFLLAEGVRPWQRVAAAAGVAGGLVTAALLVLPFFLARE